MKYRHSFHAGNFADVHKHIALLAVIASLQRKDKGFLYLDTHAGRGAYDLTDPPAAAAVREADWRHRILMASRTPARGDAGLRPRHRHTGANSSRTATPIRAPRCSPPAALRAQDRAILIELQPPEADALERAVSHHANARVECGDGYEQLRAYLPPVERRGLVLIDPPYEETSRDFERRTQAAIGDVLQRFANAAVVMLWYPIKDARDTQLWRKRLRASLPAPELGAANFGCIRRDSRIALNGSGLIIIHPPYQLAAAHAAVVTATGGGCSTLPQPEAAWWKRRSQDDAGLAR